MRFIKANLERIKAMSVEESFAKQVFAKYARQSDRQVLHQIQKFAIETVSRNPAIPKDAIVSMARLMADFGLARPRRRF